MASQEKINALSALLTEVLSDVDSAEVPYITITGDINGKGFLWKNDKGNAKQIVFNSNPDRFFISENVNLGKGKTYGINNVSVLSDSELGPSIVKSNLREVGRLRGLVVDGSLSLNQYLFYDSNSDRLGIGTDQPKSAVNIVDKNVDLVIGAPKQNTASIGTYNSTNLELITDNRARITIETSGNIVLGDPVTKTIVNGKLSVNVTTIDPRVSLHVDGAIKFNNKIHLNGTKPPVTGSFNEGDIVWNSLPTPGKFVGWICTKAGDPGLWNGFGRIE